MENIRIITDSASDLEPGFHEKVTILPISIRFGDEEYMDGITINNVQFFEKLIESDTLPQTSLISPDRFEKEFQKAKENNEKVLVITLASTLSGTYQSAMIAASEYKEFVTVIDSIGATTSENILIKYALELIEKGLSYEEIIRILEEEKNDIRLLAVLDTLEYLKKGGRISKTAAFLGEVLSIKPVVTLRDGVVSVLGKARGSKNGNNFLINEIKNSNGIDFTRPLCLGYTGLNDHMLQKYIKDSADLYQGMSADELPICSVGATIGTHVGPNCIVISYFAKRN